MAIKIQLDVNGFVYEIAPGPGAERELLAALQRAINTWETPPRWIVDLYDRLRDQNPAPSR